MGRMPDIGWMELSAGDRETDRASSIRSEDAQAHFEAGDRAGFFTAPARRRIGVIE